MLFQSNQVSAALPRLSIPCWGATAAIVVAALIPSAQLLILKVAVVADMISYTNSKSKLQKTI
jgi:hypothetical protein